jgi:hypothetical protein
VIKPVAEYYRSRSKKSGNRYRISYACKPCTLQSDRATRLARLFSLTQAEHDAILRWQNELCAICLKPPKKLPLAIDHCHATGLVRGVLCAWCNQGLAKFRDDVYRLERAVKYLYNPPASQALGEHRFGTKGRVTNKAATRRRLNRRPKLPTS